MPYVITTGTALTVSGRPGKDGTRTAVATLDEAREVIKQARIAATPTLAHEGKMGDALIARMFPAEGGGTVGPLPDGTVIEVARVEWRAVIEGAGLAFDDFDGPVEDALTAFNAQQS